MGWSNSGWLASKNRPDRLDDRRQLKQQIIWRDSWFLLTDFGDGDDDDFYKGKAWTVKVSTVMLQCYLVRNPGSTMTGSI